MNIYEVVLSEEMIKNFFEGYDELRQIKLIQNSKNAGAYIAEFNNSIEYLNNCETKGLFCSIRNGVICPSKDLMNKYPNIKEEWLSFILSLSQKENQNIY